MRASSRAVVLAPVVVAAAVVVMLLASDSDTPWVSVGSIEEVRASGIVYLEAHEAFVVASDDAFIALSAHAPHVPNDRVLYCPSSGWFVGRHGESFDSRGIYALGPASAGLTRLAVRVIDGSVEVDPAATLGAPARGAFTSERPSGPFCDNDGRTPPVEAEPGFTSLEAND